MKTCCTLLIAMFVLAFTTLITPTSMAAEATVAGPITVGDHVTDFTLPVVGTDGEVTLSDEYKQGPVVLVMLRGYPGYQCPLCSRQVGSLAKTAGELGKLAQRVIFVYPGEASMLDKHAEEFMGKSTLPSPLIMVRDPGMKMVADWNLRWDAPNETAYPSTYVIDREGKVRWSKVSDSHGGRTTSEEILSELKNCKLCTVASISRRGLTLRIGTVRIQLPLPNLTWGVFEHCPPGRVRPLFEKRTRSFDSSHSYRRHRR